MAHVIEWVNPHGVAARRGIKAGDSLIAINNEPILDEIDYQALSNKSRLDLTILRANGKEETIQILTAREMPLGMQLADTLACKPRACKNKCVFCKAHFLLITGRIFGIIFVKIPNSTNGMWSF